MNQDWAFASANANGMRPALTFGNETWSFHKLNDHANLIAQRLDQLGFKSGDHAAVLLPTSLEYAALVFALGKIGAVLVPLSRRLTSEEIDWQIAHAGCKAIIYSRIDEQRVQALKPEVQKIEIAQIAEAEDTEGLPIRQFKTHFDSTSLQAIIFTSGTTGRPKGAQLTWDNHFWSAAASAWRLGVLPTDRWLTCLPLNHVGGLAIILRCVLYGIEAILHDGFDAAAVNEAIDQRKVTIVSLVPTMLRRLLEQRKNRPFPGTLRLVLLGGAAAPFDLLRDAHRLGAPIALTYGLTEAASQVATMTPETVHRKLGSVGKPLMFTNVRIADSQGGSAPPNVPGEIVVSGAAVMKGYIHQSPESTLHDGEFYTGDIGYMDVDGDLWLMQRRHDLIISGGENVYPAEIERVMQEHPAVSDVCVVGMPDLEWGETAAAAVILRNGFQISAAELEEFLRARIAGYKIPRRYRFVTEFPLTNSGKISREAVKALFQESL